MRWETAGGGYHKNILFWKKPHLLNNEQHEDTIPTALNPRPNSWGQENTLGPHNGLKGIAMLATIEPKCAATYAWILMKSSPPCQQILQKAIYNNDHRNRATKEKGMLLYGRAQLKTNETNFCNFKLFTVCRLLVTISCWIHWMSLKIKPIAVWLCSHYILMHSGSF